MYGDVEDLLYINYTVYRSIILLEYYVYTGLLLQHVWGCRGSIFYINYTVYRSIILLAYFLQHVQWNLSIKDTLNSGHLSNEDTVCCPNHIDLCTNLPLN